MTETLAALLFAHALADFILQPGWMARGKGKTGILALHGLVVLAAATLATGAAHPALLGLAAIHAAIDGVKAWVQNRTRARGIGPFLIDQGAHVAAVLAVAQVWPGLWAGGIWAGLPLAPPALALLAGLVITLRAGGFAVGLLMEPWSTEAPRGLAGGGRVIGTLERGLIFLLILAGQAEGIGLLIAAKSVLRFSAVKDDLKVSEYVIIGTLASFAWAILTSYLTVFLLSGLTPLHMPDLTP